ncbi:hypothetical protein PB01_12225 [Psychrobacillus glaciei]|uniref:Uncharacterized protein n=1 Tax=Psychrobacillus glaciei TaxID=2283160 RepID=A0A5J6SPU7_9BACI|nr:hypothetical protein PB01_12225 [Psychrobacillus glaciei]
MFSALKEKRKAPQERSDEETEAMPAKSVRRSGKQRHSNATLLKSTGHLFARFFLLIRTEV